MSISAAYWKARSVHGNEDVKAHALRQIHEGGDLEALRELILLHYATEGTPERKEFEAFLLTLQALLQEDQEAEDAASRPPQPLQTWQMMAWAEWRATWRLYHRALTRWREYPYDREADRDAEWLGIQLLSAHRDLGRTLEGEKARREDQRRALQLVQALLEPGVRENRFFLEEVFSLLAYPEVMKAAQREIQKAQEELREEEAMAHA